MNLPKSAGYNLLQLAGRAIALTALASTFLCHLALVKPLSPQKLFFDTDLGPTPWVQFIFGRCEVESCTESNRRLALQQLRALFPSRFLEVAGRVYGEVPQLRSTAAREYWELRISAVSGPEREALLWDVFYGRIEGAVPSSDVPPAKALAADLLCETGDLSRFIELRDYFVARWLDLSRTVASVTHCRDRMTVIHEYGPGVDAPLSILDGRYKTDNRESMLWAFQRLDEFLEGNKLSDELLLQIEEDLSKQALEWQVGADRTPSHEGTYYNEAWRILARRFGWRTKEFRDAGLTLLPSPP